jgi:hypothetical protein
VAKLPRPSGKEMVRFLERQGFTLLRVRGSHHFLERAYQRALCRFMETAIPRSARCKAFFATSG